MLFERSCRHVKIGHINRIYPPWLLWNKKDQGTELIHGYAGQTGNRRLQRWFPIPPTPTLHLMHGVPEEPPRRHTCHLPELRDGGSFYSIPEVTAELILT